MNNMLVKLFLVVSLATFVLSFHKDENELVNTALGSGTNLMKEFSKLIANDPDKYSVDLNLVYKKYELASKAEQARSYLTTMSKKMIDYINEYIKKVDIESEDKMKKSIEIIKKEDPVLGEKLMKLYEKQCEMDRVVEDVLKLYLDADKLGNKLEKARTVVEHQLVEYIKKLETFIIEHLPKKGKK